MASSCLRKMFLTTLFMVIMFLIILFTPGWHKGTSITRSIKESIYIRVSGELTSTQMQINNHTMLWLFSDTTPVTQKVIHQYQELLKTKQTYNLLALSDIASVTHMVVHNTKTTNGSNTFCDCQVGNCICQHKT